MITKIKNFVLDILFPAPEIPENLRLYDTLFCPLCRARQAGNIKICHRSTQYQLAAATDYRDERVQKLIWQMKYRNRYGLAESLASLMIKYIETLNLNLSAYIIVPIPLSEKRYQERGYNQAFLLAQALAGKFGLTVIEEALVRQKHSAPQAEIRGWDERKKNIAGCFGIANPTPVKNKNIILVDDVFTSGATMSEAAHQLKDFGAKKIIGLVIAKAG